MSRVLLLLLAFGASLAVRIALGGDDVARSTGAGLAFAACLVVVALAAGTRVGWSRQALGYGLAGVVLVCLPVGLEHLLAVRPLRSTTGFAGWAVVVTVVASAEELFLRGALYDAAVRWRGPVEAVLLGAVCFALLHLPLYGWQALPLDLAVGIVLGGLRRATGTPAAPAITHVGADLVGWFVR